MPCAPALFAPACYHREVLSWLSFDAPWLLLGLLLLPALPLLLPRRGAWVVRLAALALLITALAQPSVERPGRDVAVLVDVSDSVGAGALEALQDFDFASLRRDPSFFYFAADATEMPAGGAAEAPAYLQTERTDLSQALQVAASAGAKRVLLLSDGAESAGSARLALPGVPVDTYRVDPPPGARVLALLAPDAVSPGETVEVTAVVESDVETEVTLYPSVGGVDGEEALPPVRRRVPAGRTPFSFTFPVEGTGDLEVSARLEADFTQPTADDAQTRTIAVDERDPVLVVGDPAAAELLRAQGFEVTEGGAEAVTTPLDYSAVILRESARSFTPGQLSLLESYVDNGGGLFMTGGPDSFGLGAWYRTPVEAVLPVNTDLRTEVELPLVAMVIVLDRSQSMSSGNPSKIDLAKEGAIGVVELAYQDDTLGMVVFSDKEEWAFNLRKATERGKREMLASILNIEPQGGTVLEPAYREAFTALQGSDAAIKHIIILSDGEFNDGGAFGGGSSVDFAALAALGLTQGVTTSTIAIGAGADPRLGAIASAGGGRYYSALNVNTLPQIFTNEALTATRSLLREEQVSPTLQRNPLTPDLRGSVPPLDAYIASSLKRDAETLLEGVQGEPVLAISRQGLGRSAALTTDLNAWAGDFGSWSELPALLGTVTRWLQANPAEFSATVTPDGTGLKVVVDAVKDGEYINNQPLEARYNGVTQPLEQVAPGRYEGRLETPADGGALLVVNGSDVAARAPVGDPNTEFATAEGRALLQEVARASGGEVLEVPGTYAPPIPSDALPVWPLFAGLGLALFMAELLARRFWPARDV